MKNHNRKKKIRTSLLSMAASLIMLIALLPTSVLAGSGGEAAKTGEGISEISGDAVLNPGEYEIKVSYILCDSNMPLKFYVTASTNSLNMVRESDASSYQYTSATLKVEEDGSAAIYFDVDTTGALQGAGGSVGLQVTGAGSADTSGAKITGTEGYTTVIDKSKIDIATEMSLPVTLGEETVITYLDYYSSFMSSSYDRYFENYETVLYIDWGDLISSKDKSYTGTFHIDQFGEYDITVTVTVNSDGFISSAEITGSGFGGTYEEVNKVKLQSAIEGMRDKLIGLYVGENDAALSNMEGVDAVSGATYSSKGIKEAVISALNLVVDEEALFVPDSIPAAGTYSVEIAYYSDVVCHSLVESDKAKAVLSVDDNGNMYITIETLNGTSTEPLYLRDFNGYYDENNLNGIIIADGAGVSYGDTDYTDQYFAEGDRVVTQITFPLTGNISATYYTNVYLYVPAMNALNGTIMGIEFENGNFSVNGILDIYWDTLEEISSGGDDPDDPDSDNPDNPDPDNPDPEDPDNPGDSGDPDNPGESGGADECYIVTVPEEIDMGTLSKTEDSRQNYTINVMTKDLAGGSICVTGEAFGTLTCANDTEKTLAFKNSLDTQYVLGGTGDEGKDLAGAITVTAQDANAAAKEGASGTFSGTTIFTICYTSGN